MHRKWQRKERLQQSLRRGSRGLAVESLEPRTLLSVTPGIPDIDPFGFLSGEPFSLQLPANAFHEARSLADTSCVAVDVSEDGLLTITPKGKLADLANNLRDRIPSLESLIPDSVRERLQNVLDTHLPVIEDLPGAGLGFLDEALAATDSISEPPLALMSQSLAASPAEDLGAVDFLSLEGIDLSTGDLWYSLETTHEGLLTLQTLPATAGSVAMTLYDSDGNALLDSHSVDGGQRIDWQTAPDIAYSLQLTGSASDVDLKIANLVHQAGTAVTVNGTALADTFVFNVDGSPAAINGVEYDFNQYESIAFDGGAGDDAATLIGGVGDEIARLFPDHGSFTGRGFELVLQDVATITAHGGGGTDSAFLYDSPGDDEFLAGMGHGKMWGDGFALETFDFTHNFGYATTKDGGNDTAQMEDTGGADKFKFDWAKAGQFFGKMYGGGRYTNRAKSFEQIDAVMSEGKDTVRLFDSTGDDTLTGQQHETRMTGPGYEVTVSGYDTLAAYASTGLDIANLTDSDHDDTARALAHKAVMWAGDAANPIYRIVARKFDEYHLDSTHAGFDRVDLYDTVLRDHVNTLGNQLSLFTDAAHLDLLHDVVGYERVNLRAAFSGIRNTLRQQAPIEFDLVYDEALWDELL